MKNKIRPIVMLASGLLWAGFAQAQESVNAGGGDASSAGGSVAYSVGQLVYTTPTGSTGSVAQGVQQPFEISVVTGVEETAIQLEMNAYPNPTMDYLNLRVSAYEGLSLQLTDVRGAVLESKKLSDNNTTISLEGVAKATYFLTVSSDDQVIKTFKITKI